MSRNAFALFLAHARKAKGLTQAQLAPLVEVESGQVSRWERGLSLPTDRNLDRLANALKVDLAELTSLAFSAAQEEGAEARRELADVRRDLEYALSQVKLFVDTYGEFHAEYQRIGDQVNQLAADIAEIKQVVLRRAVRPRRS